MQQHVIGDTLFSSQQISAGVAQVARQLNQHYQGQSVVVISVVPGGILFTADLVRQLEFDLAMDYIACPHTPGDRDNQSPLFTSKPLVLPISQCWWWMMLWNLAQPCSA
ncbi:hypothetical protein [Agarivorans gilvus]|uniref:hypothetical protein n=1 Tax=Agarivorans gilvus TaxID=680279 RepID=UPI000A58B86A|nr:hypothetical protein [Agarivorans gilvus]